MPMRRMSLVLLLTLLAVGSAVAKKDIYQQDPGFRGIEFGAQPPAGMKLVDDTRAPILVYSRHPDSSKIGLGLVDEARYYFHKDLGFYKMTVDFRHTQNQPVFDEIKRMFGAPTQVLPLGDTELAIWLRTDHTVEISRVKSGSSSLKVVSTALQPQVGDN